MKKTSHWDFLWYALYAFAGLGVEMLLLALVEPILFGAIETSAYSPAQTIIHWLLTILCWGVVAVWLRHSAKKNLGFSLPGHAKPTVNGVILSAILVVACIALNAFDWGTLKIIGEFQKKGILLFLFQYLYYLFEVALVFLIVAFGQRFAEGLLKRESRIPWGGLLLCATWGAIHILSKGSIATGIGVMAFSLAYGIMYLLLARNTKYTYIAIAIAFTI